MKKILFLLFLATSCGSLVYGQATISIFAGGGSSLGDGGPATAASVRGTQGVCSDSAGNIYILEEGGGRVRKISPSGIITTVAGHGAGGFSGDGGPATAATFDAYGLGCDAAGNLFIGDWANNRVRKVDVSTGIITTVAGNGSSSTSGDGGPATAAGIREPIGVQPDLAGNLYISEYGGSRIRKVDATTGNISTISGTVGVIRSPCEITTDAAGNVFVADQGYGGVWKINTSGTVTRVAGGGSGSGSGVPATSVSLSGSEGVTVDCAGNIYIADNGSHIRKVDASGIITSIAGGGSATITYSGIPATTALLVNQWIGIDRAGNLYITTGGSDVYKLTHSAIGGSGYTSITPRTICLGDTTSFGAGYFGGTWSSGDTSVASIDSSSGIAVGLTAGTSTISCSTPGCPTLVTSATVNPYCSGTPSPGTAVAISADTCGHPDTLVLTGGSVGCGLTYQWQSSPNEITWTNIAGATSLAYPHYRAYTTVYYRCIVACSGSGVSTYSNSVLILSSTGVGLHTVTTTHDTVCSGAAFYVSTCSAPATYFNVTTWYGDGSSDNNNLDTTSGLPHANIIHSYAYPGTYSIKQILYDGTMPVDSTVFSYEYTYCSTIPVKYYIDVNNNCVFDSADYYLSIPISVEVDSDGVAIDTISATGGFYYKTNGGPGTVYAFKFMHDTSWETCPTSGIIYDTITSYVNLYPVNYLAVKGSSVHFDLALFTVVPVTGVNDQWGHIYIQNNLGVPTNSTITLNYDSRRYLTTESRPMGAVSGSSATWTVPAVSPTASRPTDIYYVLRDVGAALPIGDIEAGSFCVTPSTGDLDTSNNDNTRGDTVKGGCDPNYMECSPSGCLPYTTAPSKLQYTIHFENTGNDTAFNIYVLDTLPANVNPRTLKVLLASSNMNISIFNEGGLNIVKFDFPAINLLDSSHHGLCDGAVIFTINTVAGLSLGTSVSNRAGIYFDYNPVVMTNSATDTVGCPTISSTSNVQRTENLELFPNPVSDELTLVTNPTIYNKATVTSTIGQTILQQTITNVYSTINVATLPGGIYYIIVSGQGNNSKMRKFVKM